MRSGQTSLRKLVTDLNTDCNPQGPQQGWTSSADGCQLYHTSRKSRQWRWGAESRQQAKGREGLTNQTQFPPPAHSSMDDGRRDGGAAVCSTCTLMSSAPEGLDKSSAITEL